MSSDQEMASFGFTDRLTEQQPELLKLFLASSDKAADWQIPRNVRILHGRMDVSRYL